MSLTLGEKLRQAREERGITISEVAEQTRISALYLGCIENDDYRTLPGGIFNKGFIKSFAKYVGVDEQEALQDYALLVANQDNEIVDEPKTYRPQVLSNDNDSSRLTTIIFAGVILALMVAGVLMLVRYLEPLATQPTANTALNANTISNINLTNGGVANTNATNAPTVDKIEAEIKAVRQNLWVQYQIDGKTVAKVIKADAPLKIEAQKKLIISYSKAQAKNIQIMLNGKEIELPNADVKGNNISFEISRENIQGILQNGRIGTQ